MNKMTKFILVVYISLVLGSFHDVNSSKLSKGAARIIGGDLARAGQFPFAAAIYITRFDGTFFCGGTIISNQWILTAAQCVAQAREFTIRLGTTQLNSGGTWAASNFYDIASGFDYDSLANDVGLIRLREPITFTDYIQPVDFLAEAPLDDNSEVITIGWGQTSDAVGGLTNDLNYVNLVSLAHEECESVFGMQLTDTMFCAAGSYNEGTCRGDLGSPLIHYESLDTSYLVGVSSFISTKGCESTDPSGFTKLAPYREWIRNVTGV